MSAAVKVECRKCEQEIQYEADGEWAGQWVEADQRHSVGMPEVCMTIPGDDKHEPRTDA